MDSGISPKTRASVWRARAVIIAGFISSRIAFYLFGGRFVASPIDFALQYLDPQLLKNDLLRSLVYLHSQPPGFNLFLGSVLKISTAPDTAFMLAFQAAGLLSCLFLYELLRAVRVPSWAAVALTLAYMLNPTVLLYENLLYYTYAESFFLLAGAFCLLKWCHGRKFSWAIAFWLIMCCLGGIRSVFHPFFFVGLSVVLGIAIASNYGLRQKSLAFCCASLLAIAPLGLVMFKNHVLYGFWGTSSWDGMNLWTKASGYGPEELDELHRKGVIGSMAVDAGLEPFRPLDQYEHRAELLDAPCHNAADCKPYKSNGRVNLNHAGYVLLSQSLWKDSVSLIKHDPARFAFQTLASYSLTLWHSSDSVHGLFQDNMEILAPLEAAYRYAYFGFTGVQNKFADDRLWFRTAIISALYALVYAVTIISIYRPGSRPENDYGPVLLFCLAAHAFTIVVSSIIEFGENNRFRFPVDGIFLIMLAAACTKLFQLNRPRIRE